MTSHRATALAVSANIRDDPAVAKVMNTQGARLADDHPPTSDRRVEPRPRFRRQYPRRWVEVDLIGRTASPIARVQWCNGQDHGLFRTGLK